jgi:acyl-CoA reductase-like NAD-dependent aldehyde dehydrogenase
MSTSTVVSESPAVANGNAHVAAAEAPDVAQEVARARRAQPAWAARPLNERLALIRRFRHLIPTHAHELLAPIHPGRRSAAESLGAEIMPLADACRFVETHAPRILKPYRLGLRFRPIWLFGVRSEVRREPYGVVLIIGPSNYPLFLTASQAIQALAAGNAVILKPGNGGAATAQVFARLLEQAGLDPSLLRVLPESPEAAQAAIAAGVDKVLLTGSARTGASVLAQLAPRLVPAAMELSGCDPVFVRADADLDLVTRALRFGFRLNHGETCIAPRRVFVDRSLAPELKNRMAAVGTELSSVVIRTPAAQVAAARVAEALQKGAELVAGRTLPDNQGLTPTVLAGTTPNMAVMREDTFAPVVSLVEVNSDDEALAVASQCPYGLGASVFGDPARAQELAQRVPAGVVVINDMIAPTVDPRLPFGGRRHSGFGVTRGTEGLLELTAVKVVVIRYGQLNWHLDGPDPEDAPLFEAYLRGAHGASWWTRLTGWFTFFRLMIRKSWGAKKTVSPVG